MKNNATIQQICSQIASLADVSKIYLFSHKTDISGNLTSFKLVVIINTGDKTACEKVLYLQIESSLSFDVVVYTKNEWDEFVQKPFSFASKVSQKGCVVYGA